MIRPRLTHEQVKKAMEMACERCKHFEDCDENGWYERDQGTPFYFGQYYNRILQEFE